MAGRIRVNYFDCGSCGTTKNYAFLHECPNCGTPNPGQASWYKGPYVDGDIEMLKRAAKKPFWKCSSCSGSNYGEDKTACEHCGEPHDPSDKDAKVLTRDYVAPEGARSNDLSDEESTPASTSSYSTSYTTTPAPAPASKLRIKSSAYSSLPQATSSSYSSGSSTKKNTALLIAGIVAFLLLCVSAIVYFGFDTNTVEGKVSQVTWTWTIDIQKYKVVHESDTTSSPPSDAYNESSWTTTEKVAVYKTVPGEYHKKECTRDKDLGNGFTEEEVYDCSYTDPSTQEIDHYDDVKTTHYSYDVNRWSYERSVSSSGANFEVFPPTYTLNLEGQTAIGAEKVSGQTQTFTVHFEWYNQEEEKLTDTLEPSEAEWRQYVVGNYYPLEVNRLNKIMNNPLVPAE